MLGRCVRRLNKKYIDAGRSMLNLDIAVIEAAGNIEGQAVRSYSKMPSEYESFYGTIQQAVRKPRSVQAASSQASEATESIQREPLLPQAPPDTNASTQQYAAQSATRWMLPWEKRQMSGEKGPLRDWEKLYWGVFVSAIAFLLWSKLLRGTPIETEDDTQEKAEKERKKLRAARLLLAGQGLSDEDDELLEGMTPQEIQSLVEEKLGNSQDPFEGLTPQEINDLLLPSQSDSAVPQLQG